MNWDDRIVSIARTRWELIQEMRSFERLDNTGYSRGSLYKRILENDSILLEDGKLEISDTPPTANRMSYLVNLNYPEYQQCLFFFMFLEDLYKLYPATHHYILHNTAFYDAMDFQLDHSLVFDMNQIQLFVPREQVNKEGLMRLLLRHTQKKLDWNWTI